MTTLAVCPKCGNKCEAFSAIDANYYNYFGVECSHCEYEMSSSRFKSKADAIEAHNDQPFIAALINEIQKLEHDYKSAQQDIQILRDEVTHWKNEVEGY